MSDDLLTLTETQIRLTITTWLQESDAGVLEGDCTCDYCVTERDRCFAVLLTRLRAQRSTPETLPEISPDDWRWQLWRHTQPGLALREQCGGAEMCCLSEPEYQAALARLLAAAGEGSGE